VCKKPGEGSGSHTDAAGGTKLGLSGSMKKKQAHKEDKPLDNDKDLHKLQTEELTGEESHEEDLDASDTDDDEDEGVGDGNLGRTTPDILEK
jgi:hypothetical protein